MLAGTLFAVSLSQQLYYAGTPGRVYYGSGTPVTPPHGGGSRYVSEGSPLAWVRKAQPADLTRGLVCSICGAAVGCASSRQFMHRGHVAIYRAQRGAGHYRARHPLS